MFDSEFIRGTLTPILAIAGTVFGLIGTVIGIFNLWVSWRDRRIKVTLEYQIGELQLITGCLSTQIHVRMINHSYFDVTVSDVGIVYNDGSKLSAFEGSRILARDDATTDKIVAPARTQRRGWAGGLLPAERLENASCFYATLSNGRQITSKRASEELNELRRKILKYDEDHPEAQMGLSDFLGI